ncbi:MAG: bifunctional (p)ppGpp synthetase/guanosine-3',5'-bis(diphosphate) 3'-pyrophosphohydrolase [Gammaproteobacteria bacterium]|nr:bifunctional (p)ppGpp synthetase/guanosine-3',5'-bis(diphosphate) 3'-pyrophosphohydrolase [Gammaproteobacteria bacterium]
MKHALTPQDKIFSELSQTTTHLCLNVADEHRVLLVKAIEAAWLLEQNQRVLVSSLRVAFRLKNLGADEETLMAALFSAPLMEQEQSLDFIAQEYGETVAALVKSTRWLHSLEYEEVHAEAPDQAERVRRMVLAIVNDVRAVLIKLAYRAQRLHHLNQEDEAMRHRVAKETLDIYAPLANRLGIGELKWELEDLAFRYLEPLAYKQIAKALEERREDREYFIHSFMILLQEELDKEGLEGVDISGRPKHIYSIWRKMQKKQMEFKELFDVRAVRVMVNRVSECYAVLGVVHSLWRHIPQEFDDYIANQKSNGYRSLHTAVLGPEGKSVEVQIRTREMHEHAEHGVAAHWRYKEGTPNDSKLDDGIAVLRQLLEPGQEDDVLLESFDGEMFGDRVFVLTPKGEVLDLLAGATPLDFAFQVHTQIGYRCRGAKVNGRIVPLAYVLKNGDQVEILTNSVPKPSRDWLNKNLSYLHTSRARIKVRAWFNIQDHEQHLDEGRHILARELKRLNLKNVDLEALVHRLGYKKQSELLEALGRNQINAGHLVEGIESLLAPLETEEPCRPVVSAERSVASEVRVLGVGNLLTRIANCCKPVPYDEIIGFITQGKGVTVHRFDCNNVQNLSDIEQPRLVEVSWGEGKGHYSVDVRVIAYDRTGLLKDITSILSNEQINVTALNTHSDFKKQTARFHFTLEVSDMRQLGSVLLKIEQLPNILEVGREG